MTTRSTTTARKSNSTNDATDTPKTEPKPTTKRQTRRQRFGAKKWESFKKQKKRLFDAPIPDLAELPYINSCFPPTWSHTGSYTHFEQFVQTRTRQLLAENKPTEANSKMAKGIRKVSIAYIQFMKECMRKAGISNADYDKAAAVINQLVNPNFCKAVLFAEYRVNPNRPSADKIDPVTNTYDLYDGVFGDDPETWDARFDVIAAWHLAGEPEAFWKGISTTIKDANVIEALRAEKIEAYRNSKADGDGANSVTGLRYKKNRNLASTNDFQFGSWKKPVGAKKTFKIK